MTMKPIPSNLLQNNMVVALIQLYQAYQTKKSDTVEKLVRTYLNQVKVQHKSAQDIVDDTANSTTGDDVKDLVAVYTIIFNSLLFALVFKHTQLVEPLKQFLLDNIITYILTPGEVLKDILSKVRQDPAVIAGLESLYNQYNLNQTDMSLATATTSSASTTVKTPVNNTTSKLDVTVNAQLGSAMYHIITYDKSYSKLARQHIVFRKLDTTTDKYRLGIVGQPRMLPWNADPLFDSIDQAKDFLNNLMYLPTKRDLANYKFSISDKPLPDGTSDLSGYVLVDTILGPAYISKQCQYYQ